MSETNGLGKKVYISGVPVILKRSVIKLPEDINTMKYLKKYNTKIAVRPRSTNLREDVICDMTGEACARLGDYRKLSIINRYDSARNTSHTVANLITKLNSLLHHTSENVVKLIGQSGYDTVFLALCSVINQDLKIKAILALLTSPKTTETVSTQTESDRGHGPVSEKSCQTDILMPQVVLKGTKRRRLRRQRLPYVVKDEIEIKESATEKPFYVNEKAKSKQHFNRIIINPQQMEKLDDNIDLLLNKTEICTKTDPQRPINKSSSMEDISHLLDNDSNFSDGSNFSLGSIGSVNTDIFNSATKTLIQSVDQHTNVKGIVTLELTENSPKGTSPSEEDFFGNKPEGFRVTTIDGTVITLTVKPEDDLHIATKENLAKLSLDHKKRLLWHQAYLDWKHCLQTNEDNHLPIHDAVIRSDIELVRRQCVVLKARSQSVDIGDAEYNLSALQMAILHQSSMECVKVLLHHGADPLECDDEGKTALHHAAECGDVRYLMSLLNYCRENTRKLLQNNRLWNNSIDNESEVSLTRQLFMQASVMYDSHGYTALMLASKLGHYQHVCELLKAVSETINNGMPNSGNTALYIAVESACMEAVDNGNKSKIADKFAKTIDTLIDYGADPAINNISGNNVNDILTEFAISELSMLITNKLISMHRFETPSNTREPFILIKDEKGQITNKGTKTQLPETQLEKIPKENDSKVKILQNIEVRTGKPLLVMSARASTSAFATQKASNIVIRKPSRSTSVATNTSGKNQNGVNLNGASKRKIGETTPTSIQKNRKI